MIYFAAAELAPFAKVGGLADVVGSLPKALAHLGIETTILFPHYADLNLEGAEVVSTDEVLLVPIGDGTQTVTLSKTMLPGSSVPVLLFGHDAWIGNGGTYASAPLPDLPKVDPNLPRFALFSAAVAKYVAEHAKPGTILHAHDWHVAASIPILKNAYGTAHVSTLLTIHNLAYQGGTGFAAARTVFGDDLLKTLPKEALLGEEPHKWYNLLLAGILTADWVSTVSPSYRNEILTPEYGEKLEWALAQRDDRLVGILNGVDTQGWDPATDPKIAAPYDVDTLQKKQQNKAKLQEELSLPVDADAPLFGMVSRLAEQKGFAIFLPAIPEMLAAVPGLQLAFLATGDPQYAADLKALEERFPDRVAFHDRFDEHLAHQIYAGSDAFFIPSRFEPCGLGQLFAMRYGTLPIARSTGGLKDTVTNGETGFRFDTYTSEALLEVVQRAAEVFRNDPTTWNAMVKNAMAYDSTWSASAELYQRLYQAMVSS